MRNCIVKEEEQNVQTPVSTSKTEPYNLNKRKDKEENQSFQQAYLKAVSKFLQALHILQLAQHRSQNLGIPSYPFVLQYQYNEFWQVHLGGHKIDVANTPDRNDCQEQLHMQQFVPRLNTQQCVSIKLGIHKRKGMLNQEQKDTKTFPRTIVRLQSLLLQKSSSLSLNTGRLAQVYKRKLMNIRTFSGLLSQSEDPHEEEFNQTFRILSRIFVKKYAINYIFNSKIVQHNWHLRYRQQIYKGIKILRTSPISRNYDTLENLNINIIEDYFYNEIQLTILLIFGKEIDIILANLINRIRSEIAEKDPYHFKEFWHQAFLLIEYRLHLRMKIQLLDEK